MDELTEPFTHAPHTTPLLTFENLGKNVNNNTNEPVAPLVHFSLLLDSRLLDSYTSVNMTTVGPLRRCTCRCCLLVVIISISVFHCLFHVRCTDTVTTVDSIVIFGDSLSDTGSN